MLVSRLGLGDTGVGAESGSGFGYGSEPIDKRLLELIEVEFTRSILDATS